MGYSSTRDTAMSADMTVFTVVVIGYIFALIFGV